MNQREHREARVDGRVADRGPATIGVPADDLAGEAYAAQGLRTRGEPHPGRRHLEDVGAAGGVEHIRPREEARERLAVLAVAEESKARGRRDLTRDAAQ